MEYLSILVSAVQCMLMMSKWHTSKWKGLLELSRDRTGNIHFGPGLAVVLPLKLVAVVRMKIMGSQIL